MNRNLLPSIMLLGSLALSRPAATAEDTRPASEAALLIRIVGLDSSTGTVMIALFDSESAYGDGNSPLRGISLRLTGGSHDVTLGLAPGRYAIKAFHDLNGNGRLDTNPFGIPIEPVAFSNGAHPHMGPPSWHDASFEVRSGANAQEITLR